MLESVSLSGFFAYGVVAAEVISSIMMICSVWTRLSSAVFAVNMVVAVFMAHVAQIFSVDTITGGWAIELPMHYLLGFLVLCFTGAGKYAVTK